MQFTVIQTPKGTLVTELLADHHRTCDTGTNLCMDYADTCSLGFDGEQYFLLIVDRLVNFNTNLGQDPVKFLEEYITITKLTPRFLRVDGARDSAGKIT